MRRRFFLCFIVFMYAYNTIHMYYRAGETGKTQSTYINGYSYPYRDHVQNVRTESPPIHYSTLLLGKRLGWGVPLPRLNVAIRFVKIKLECVKIPMIIYHQVHETIKKLKRILFMFLCSCFYFFTHSKSNWQKSTQLFNPKKSNWYPS